MKLKSKSQYRILSTLAALALAGSASLCVAAGISYTFDSDVQGWYAADGHGSVAWSSTNGVGGGGCLKYTIVGGTDSEVDPRVDVAFNTAQYWTLEFDMMVDPASGTDAGGSYGNLQGVFRDSTWSWDSMWYGAVDASFNSYKHVSFGVVGPYKDEAHIQLQLGGAAPYSGDVIVYIDNVVLNPVPLALYINQFTNADEVTAWTWANWSQPGTDEWVMSPDAGGATPTGSMKLNCNFGDLPNGYQQVVFSKNFSCDPSRFTYLDMDIKLDPASFPRVNGTGYGHFENILAANGWAWFGLGAMDLTINNTNWTHFSCPIAGHGITNMQQFILKLGENNFTNTVILYVDNIKFWTPQVPPSVSLKAAGPGGLQIVSDQPANQWQRQNIVTPSGSYGYSWIGNSYGTPVTYSFTITNFPDAAAHPGFEAHAYLVNYDTLPTPAAWNETYSAIDWNASDIVVAALRNNGGGGVDFSFNFKTNLPGAGINNTVATLHGPSALGTWSVSFQNDVNVTLSGPGGISTNFVIDAAVAAQFGGNMLLDFGTFKNNFVNNGASATFSQIHVVGSGMPFDELFAGPGLNPNPATPNWRLAADDAAAITWVPSGAAWWLTWTLPDTGFTPQSAASPAGPWADAGITYVFEGSTGKSGAVPVGLPAGNKGFFRMMKPAGP